jgi:hypothetical protein
MPDGALEDVLGRHVVGIQDQDQVARGMGQRRVDVAGLGGDVAVAGQVVDPKLGAQGLKALVALKRFRGLAGIGVGAFLDRAAVVQQVYGQLVRRIIDLGRGGQGDPQQVASSL